MSPRIKDVTQERIARYRVFWEWRRYEEAIAEVRALIRENPAIQYQEDLAAMLLERSGSASFQEACSLLRALNQQGRASSFAIASLAEALALIETSDTAEKTSILDSLNRTIVAEDPTEPDPYLYYAKALLCRSLERKIDAIAALDEAISRERYRQRNLYTFDPVRLEKYQRLRAEWASEGKALTKANETS